MKRQKYRRKVESRSLAELKSCFSFFRSFKRGSILQGHDGWIVLPGGRAGEGLSGRCQQEAPWAGNDSDRVFDFCSRSSHRYTSFAATLGLGAGSDHGLAHSGWLAPPHWGGVSPTISMPCCCNCALKRAFSFFSSSI